MSAYSSHLCLVLKKRQNKDTDLSLTLLTEDLGKINALAKNANRLLSRRLSALQLGNTIKCQLYTRGDQHWISEVEIITSTLTSQISLTQINLTFYYLEILNILIALGQHIPQLFQLACHTISYIRSNNFPKFIKAEINLLELLGFGVPSEVVDAYTTQDYRKAQNLIKNFLESITERKFESYKLFS